MHTFAETAAGVPAFLAKLWRLVDDPETNNLICWSKDGRSFIIQNQAQFARELLPLNYKHNNMASFIRQLNMYGFHKITSIDNGGLKFDRDEMEFSHPCFKRNCPYLLEHIKRKIANTKSLDEKSAVKPEAVSKVLQDVKAMRGRQDSLDSRFSVMKQENEALWREIASLRQKHAKQQQIVNKLIQFLITIVQPSRNMTSVKRHMQLMINDIPESSKLRKSSESESESGPVIHELSEELLDEVTDPDNELINLYTPYGKAAQLQERESRSPYNNIDERPHSSGSMVSQNYDYSTQSAEDVPGGSGGATASGSNVENAGSLHQESITNMDGTKLMYHVTEIPDAHEPQMSHDMIAENVATLSPNCQEENVLTTPLVRQEMARNQLLKQRNKQRRKQEQDLDDAAAKVPCRTRQQQQQQRQQQQQSSSRTIPMTMPEPIAIKAEPEQQPDIDPMLFLNSYTDNANSRTSQPSMISPNISEDSVQADAAGQMQMQTISANRPNSDTATLMNDATTSGMNMYNSNDFMAADEMPSELFEVDSMNDDYKLKPQAQEQFGRSAATSGKFSSFLAGNNGNNARGGPSTSAAAAAASMSSAPSTSTALVASLDAGKNRRSSSSQGKGGNNNNNNNNNNNDANMTVAKYNKNNNNEEILRDEVHGHLDSVQDELEMLKDLLRGDGYSLDTNTLMGQMPPTSRSQMFLTQGLDADILKLFNDSEILGPYGLQFPAEGFNDNKKGSELTAYQPMYDLSDIIDIGKSPALTDGGNTATSNKNNTATTTSAAAAATQQSSSVLNTPYHE